MKTLAIIAITGALATPALAFGQTTYEPAGSASDNGPVTRAQVRGDLIQLERAGYNPALSDNAHYPDNIQAAEARASGQNDAQTTDSGMGGVPAGSSASGAPARGTYGAMPDYSSYSGRTSYGSQQCDGPQTFCNIYSGGR